MTLSTSCPVGRARCGRNCRTRRTVTELVDRLAAAHGADAPAIAVRGRGCLDTLGASSASSTKCRTSMSDDRLDVADPRDRGVRAAGRAITRDRPPSTTSCGRDCCGASAPSASAASRCRARSSGWLDLTDEQTDGAARRASERDDVVPLGRAEARGDSPTRSMTRASRFAVLKGPSVAHTIYRIPAFARSPTSICWCPRPTTSVRARCSDGSGHVRRRPEPRPGFEVRFGKASVHTHPDDGIEVDLHRTLVLGPFGLWIDPEELLDRREPFLLGGRKRRPARRHGDAPQRRDARGPGRVATPIGPAPRRGAGAAHGRGR